MAKKDRISTEGSRDAFGDNPFSGLDATNLPEAPSLASLKAETSPVSKPKKKRGRVDIIREKSGRGGKVVTVVKGLDQIQAAEREQFLKKLKSTCATGGALKGAVLEIQGDQRERVAAFFEKEGFRPVFAGG